MQKFEYLVRGDFDEIAEDEARTFGGNEHARTKAYGQAISRELNKLGGEGWALVQAPDQPSNRIWVFMRSGPG